MSLEWQLVIALLMLAGNAFFVGAEFGLVSARRSSIELEALNGSRAAKITLHAMERVPLMLAGAQLGVTLCSLIFGAIGEPLLARLLLGPVTALGLPDNFVHPFAFAGALTVLVYVHVVLGEMVPKNLALAGPSRAALWLTPPLVLFVKVTGPAVRGLSSIANFSISLLGFKPRPELASSFSRDEVAGFVKESHQEGLLSEDEEQLLTGALTFDEKNISSLLLPAGKLVTLKPTASLQEIEDCATKTGFSRFPVRNADGELTGYVHIKDVLAAEPSSPALKLPAELIRPLPELRPTTTLRRGLVVMQRCGAHLAKVLDRQGETIGVVALEDVLEELVGNIRDDA